MPVLIIFIFFFWYLSGIMSYIYIYISLHFFWCLVMSLNQESSVSKHPLGLPWVGTYTKTSTLESALNQCTTYHL
jgi:hypothetical protein